MRQGDITKMVARTIKVVQILPGLDSGGVERGTLEMGAYLSNQGHQSIVISQGGQMVPQLEQEGSTHITYRHIGAKNPLCLPYIFLLRRFLLREKVDILHVRSRLPAWVAYLAWKNMPKDRRPRLVTTFHGFYSINKYSAIMTKGEKVIAISRTIADHMKARYDVPEDHMTLIYRGFDEKSFNPDTVSLDRIKTLKKNWEIEDSESPVIMLPARISRWKGHDIFIKSLSKIQHLRWSAVCVGDLNENSRYAAFLNKLIAQLKLGKRVKFVGYCKDMPAALMTADIIVSASSTEPEAFGRIAVEAQAMGRPVIASAHGGSMETVLNQKTGWLVQPGDADALAGALKEAISDEGVRNKFGKQGQQWVKDNFSVKKMCEETVELYYQLLQERRMLAL